MPVNNISSNTVFKDEAAKLQAALKRSGIPIDLTTNEGLNTVLCVRSVMTEPEYPYKDVPQSERSARDAFLSIYDHIMGKNDGAAFVFKPGENNKPRLLYWDQTKQDFAVSEPIERIQKPKRPGWFHRLMHRLTGAHQAEFDAYERQKMLYNRAQGAIHNRDFKGAVDQRKTDVFRMYSNERTAAEDKFLHGKEWQREHELNQERMTIALSGAAGQIQSKMDELFKDAETNLLGPRMDYITIEGKPIHALLMDEYIDHCKTQNKPVDLKHFGDYCRQHPDRGNEMIAAALVNGKRVDCYAPDPKTGVFPSTPTQFKPDDALLEQCKPYADKLPKLPVDASAADRYARIQETGRLIQKLGQCRTPFALSIGSPSVRQTMFGDTNLEDVPNPLGLSAGRNALVNLTYAYLANEKNIPVHELMDPTKHLEEKRAAGQVVLDKCSKGDGKWIAEQELLGRAKIITAMADHLDHMKLTDPADLLKPENSWLMCASDTLFDLDQEETHFKNDVKALIADPKKPQITQALHDHVTHASNGLMSVPKIVKIGEQTSAREQLGYIEGFQSATDVFSGKMLFEHLKEYKANCPDGLEAAISADNQYLATSTNTAFAMDDKLRNMLDGPYNKESSIENFAKYQKNFCRFADEGGLTKHFKATFQANGLCEVTAKNTGIDKAQVQEMVKTGNAIGPVL